jgi:HEPN domain-containing protein
MAIEDLTPFGTAPKFYQGLLGEEETAALQKKAQIQGLLGAGLALAKGMSSYGPPRSALQNILGAVAGGFESSGGTYQQGLQNYQTQQQLEQLKIKQQQTRNQMTGIANAKTKYPDLAPLADIDPQEFVKAVASREETNRARERMSSYEQIGMPQAATTQQQVSTAPVASSIPLYGDPSELPVVSNQQPQQAQQQLSQLEQNKQQAALFRQKQQAALLNKDVDLARYYADQAEQLYPKASFMRVGDEIVSTVDLKPVYTAKAKPEEFTGNLGNLSLRYFKTKNPADLDANQLNFLDTKAKEMGIGEGTKINVYTGQLEKPNKAKVQEQQLNTGDQIARLNNIQFSYRPEFLNIKFRAGQAWNTLKDKVGNLPAKEKATLANYSTYKQNSIQNLNLTIKDLTGAAMSDAESGRIISSLPNPGTGVFDGDSPTEFESKLNNGIQQAKYALARKQYALKNGLKWENIDLGQMPVIINKRAGDIAKQYKLDPENPKDENTILKQLAAEFGVAF